LCGLLLAGIAHAGAPVAAKARVKDIARVQGVRDNQVFGVGLMVGLNGTGDSSQLSQQLARNMLERMQLSVAPSDLGAKNIAAVMVTATLGPFAKKGSRVDVVVSSLADAKSLQGGELLQTPLYGADREDGTAYVVAQGEISIGGFSFEGAAAAVAKNHPTVGRVPNGGIVEEEVPFVLENAGSVGLTLVDPDFTSATRLATAINTTFPDAASALDGATVKVQVPGEFRGNGRLITFIAQLEDLEISPDVPARVIINERTGTIVAHQRVRVSQVGVAHGNITVVIRETPTISQPLPFSQGTTQEVKGTSIEVQERTAHMHVLEPGVSVTELAGALNKLGVTPRDMIAIFQAIKAAGALHADLVIM
jgi:flagellar P-ring protein precursor FlgI